MSRAVKTVASIALPIVGNMVLPGIGGAIGGALGGLVSGGGVPGAVLGALGGYANAGAVGNIVGVPATPQLPWQTPTGLPWGGGIQLPWQTPTGAPASGIAGAVTGGGIRALGQSATQLATSTASDPSKFLLSVGNQLLTGSAADAAKKASQLQAGAIDQALAAQQPYTQLGADAVARIKAIQSDPAAYVQNNPFYASLAKDAERRLLANQAAKGKVGSGGTAAALQDRLLQLGHGLMQQEINTLQGQANLGQNSSSLASGLMTDRGAVGGAGVIGANNAYQTGYANQIGTLLALQNLGRVPSYQSYPSLNL